jgi:mono/diheme cytochrome c family protein
MPSKARVEISTSRLRGLFGLLLGTLIVAPAIVGAAPPKGPAKASRSTQAADPQPEAQPVDFNREVRPILSENCFTCHGFDANARKAGLRLDVQEEAFKPAASGKPALVPGKPQASELMRRVTARNGLVMPPASSGKQLKPEQVATLRRWIAQGARYSQHWAFVPPKAPALPSVKNKAWPINPIDHFVLARLEKEGLSPSPAADRNTLIRRVTLDLTGLPPTPEEVDQFLNDKMPGAYERVVDRLLASPRYGERMALKWLDLARYADTHGYHIDSHRDMWPWRNWVIDAYNRNLPYDQFIVQQIAGDLLPNATLDQKIATGFNRNHPINFEGGAIAEEYQTAYVVDRVDTTATAFMGLTMKCAQCHDHKYEPLTQKEFYRFYAYFNSIDERGLDGQKGNAVPFIKTPTPEQQAQLESYDKKIAQTDGAMKARAAEAAEAQAGWETATLASLDSSPVVSAGLVAQYGLDEMNGEQVRATELAPGINSPHARGGEPEAGTILSRMDEGVPTPVGGKAQRAGTIRGKPAWTRGKFGGALDFDGDTYVDLGDVLRFERTDKFSYGAWVSPAATGALTVLSRMDDGAAFRGWDLYLAEGKAYVHLIHEWDKNAIRVNTKTALELNKWHHLFVTYDGSSKAGGVRIYVDGKPAELDLTHNNLTGPIVTPKPAHIGRRNPGALFRGLIDEVRVYDRELSAAEVAQLAGFDAIRQILITAAEQRTPQQKETLARYYLENHDEPYRKLMAEAADSRKKRTDLDNSIPTTMVMQELEKPRDTSILIRGQYDKKGEKVTPGTPAILPPLPQDSPPNRLALARWLVDPSHPLTARVAANRYWEMYFGTGLVKTAENFGIQGERPSHPELLDWLACYFVTGDRGQAGYPLRGWRVGEKAVSSPSPNPHPPSPNPWDVKAMQRLIVTSATYRQSSALRNRQSRASNPQSAIRNPHLIDPENRLLARGPRFRLPAEFVRDQALAVSGLLAEKLGGPSVRPYQPPGLWEDIAFGGGFTAQKYEQDHGEALYRRSMYTFWKRTCPPPSLQTFDAPEREVCMVRRSVTNTPLQALVLMNDTAFVEAARKFAERLMNSRAGSSRDRVVYAYRLALVRSPKEHEIRVLLGVYDQQLAHFRADKPAAEKLLSVGESKRDEKLDAAELAAWTSVANVIFNLDEMITKN